MTKLSMILIVSSCLFACGKKDDKKEGTKDEPAATAPSGGGGGDCLVGTYEWDDNGAKRGFVFNADHTGKEIYEAGKDERPLKWSTKDDKMVHLAYIANGDQVAGEFDVPYSCAAGTFGTSSAPYKKK